MRDLYKPFYDWIEESILWGIFVLDPDFNVIFWNKWLEINTNIKKEVILGKNIFEVIPHTQKFKSYFQQALGGKAIILSQRLHKYLIPIKLKDEDTEYMQQTVQIFPFTENDEIKGIIITIENVTESVKREEDLKKQVRTLKVLNDVQRSMCFLNFEEYLERLFQGILKLTMSKLIYLFLIEDGNLNLKKSTLTLENQYEIIKDPSCIVQKALKQKETIYIPKKEESDIKFISSLARSAIAIPLLGKEDVLGVLVVEFYNEEALKRDEILNLETIVIQGVSLLENSRLMSLLRDSEERYRLLVEYSVVGVFLIQDDKIQYMNSRLIEILGYPSYIEGLEDLLNYISLEDKNRFLERYRTIIDRNLDYIIDEFKAKNTKGEDIYIQVSMVGIPYKSKRAILGAVIDITYRRKLEDELKSISITDPLTGLYNRRGFITLAEHTILLAERLSKKVFVLFLDLDNMKFINDNLGHSVGDQALIDVASILRNTFRGNDVIARFGGDEFVVFGICGEDRDKNKVVERLREEVSKFNRENKRPYNISLSIGSIVYNPKEKLDLEKILEKADQLMYEEKRRKKSTEEIRG